MIIDVDNARVYKKLLGRGIFSRRSFLLAFYQNQARGDWDTCLRLFKACFTLRRDALWCLRYLQHRVPDGHVIWPPMPPERAYQYADKSGKYQLRLERARGDVWCPIVPIFTDPVKLRECLSIYGCD